MRKIKLKKTYKGKWIGQVVNYEYPFVQHVNRVSIPLWFNPDSDLGFFWEFNINFLGSFFNFYTWIQQLKLE
jgi:hypothetical protein